jgi:hypothetical protein
MRMRHIVIFVPPRSTIFFHIISLKVRLKKKKRERKGKKEKKKRKRKSYWTQNVHCDFLYNFF